MHSWHISIACSRCEALAGSWEYGDEPEDVYRRHENCRCTVTFKSGRYRQDAWSKAEWWNVGKDNKQITARRTTGLTGGTDSATMEIRKRVGSAAEVGNIKRTVVKEAIIRGDVRDEVNADLQLVHTEAGNDGTRSYLYGGIEEAEALYKKLRGTGSPMIGKRGEWTHKERVIADTVVGVYRDKHGKEIETNAIMIIYSKTGAHLYARRPT